jgi:hypothetical protein
MSLGRWLRLCLTAGIVLFWTVLAAGPAAAAPCTGVTCVRYYADITITVTLNPSTPIPAGNTHSYTVRVTNTGWRTGGNRAPTPAPGPASGEVDVVFQEAPNEIPISAYNDSGVPFHCFGHSSVVCGAFGLPTGTTSQFTVYWRTPYTPGTYTCGIFVDSYQWTEYDESNNSLALTYEVN